MDVKKFLVFTFWCSFILLSCSSKDFSLVCEKFTTTFPNTKVLRVDVSPLRNVYEIYVETATGRPTIIYYVPEQDLIIFGEVWTTNGTSLTGERIERFLLGNFTGNCFLKTEVQ